MAAVPEPGIPSASIGNKRGRARGMRRRLRREHAFDAALPEAFGVLRKALGEIVAHERGSDRAARRNAEPGADGRGPQQRNPVTRHVFPYIPQHAQADARRVAAQRQPLLHGEQDFADSEQPDDCDKEIDPAQQIAEAEGHAQLAGNGVHADTGKQQAERHGNDGLVLRLPPQPDERTEGQKIDGEEFRRAELQRERSDAGRQKRNEKHREQRADEGRRECGGKSFRGTPLLGHRVAVERRRHRPGFAGNIEQDRGDCAAEQRTPVDARQHHDGGGRIHREGQRQQDGNAVRPAQTRQHADENAEHQPDHHQGQRFPGEKDAKPWSEERESFHGF